VIKRTIVIFLCFPLFLLFVVDATPFERSFSGVCERVLDGDTVIVNGRIIRLKGIDAPEKSQLSYDGHRIGLWSKERLKHLIEGKVVEIRFRTRGRYKRFIGVIYLNGKDINAQMVREGMAMYYGFTKDVRLKSLQFEAQIRRRGIYKTFGFDRPSHYRSKKKRRGYAAVR
jgi:micrococcal nuclease